MACLLLVGVAAVAGCSGTEGAEGSIPISTIQAQQDIISEAELLVLSAYASAMVAMEPPTFVERSRTLLNELASGRKQVSSLNDEEKRIMLALKMAHDRQRGKIKR